MPGLQKLSISDQNGNMLPSSFGYDNTNLWDGMTSFGYYNTNLWDGMASFT